MLAIFRKDLMVIIKDTGALSTLFIMPFVFIVLMSLALGGQAGGGEQERTLELPVVFEKTDKLAKEAVGELKKIKGLDVEQSFEGRRLTPKRAEDMISDGDRQWVLVFPSGFTQRMEERKKTPVRFVVDPAVDAASTAPITGTINGILAKMSSAIVIRAEVESLFENAPAPGTAMVYSVTGGLTPDRIVGQIVKAGETRLAELEQSSPSGMRPAKEPNVVQHNVPAYTTMFVFFIVMVLAESVLSEKANGTFRRLLSAPISKASILAGKTLPYYVINLTQVAIMFSVGHFIFGMSLGQSPLGLGLMSVSLAAAATGLGVLVAALAKTNAQVNGLGVLAVLALAGLGGVMIPLSVMPDVMQTVAQISPHSWALTGFQDIIVRGYGVHEILPEAGALLGFAVAFFTIGLIRFRFE